MSFSVEVSLGADRTRPDALVAEVVDAGLACSDHRVGRKRGGPAIKRRPDTDVFDVETYEEARHRRPLRAHAALEVAPVRVAVRYGVEAGLTCGAGAADI